MHNLSRFMVRMLVLSLSAALAGCSAGKAVTGEVKVVGETGSGAVPAKGPSAVYVQDFGLDYEHYQPGGLSKRQGVLRRLPGPLKGDDPQTKARKFIQEMNDALVAGFKDKGVAAYHLDSGAQLPASGWLVSGEFLEVDEGNRAMRAAIGFGAGATQMEVSVSVSDLAKGGPNQPFLRFGTVKDPGKMPGAVVTMNPYVAAGKFVMEKNASGKDIKKTASQIVNLILERGGVLPAGGK